MSIFPGIAGIIFLTLGGYKWTVIGALLCFLYGMMDGLDGIIARANGLSSKFGAWLDGVIGFILFPLMLLALSIGLKNYLALVVGSLAALSFPIQFTIIRYFKMEIIGDDYMPISSSGRFNFIRYLHGYSIFYPLLLLGTIFNKNYYVLLYFAGMGILGWAVVLFLQFKYFKNIK